MSAITPAQIQAAQDGEREARDAVYAYMAPTLRSTAEQFANSPEERRELEQEASLSLFVHLPRYQMGSRASLKTFLYKSIRQDVRNASFAMRAGGALDGDSHAEFWRVAGKVRQDVDAERNAGGDAVRPGEMHARIKEGLLNLPGKHAWSEERFQSAHELLHQGTQSMEAEEESGEWFGSSVEDPGEFSNPLEDEAKRAKRALAHELLAQLSDRARQIVEMSYGIGQPDGEGVPGVLETAGGARMKGQRQSGAVTDAVIAEALGFDDVKSVKKRRNEALKRLRKLVADLAYPGQDRSATTAKGRRLLDAVRANDEGVYVRSLPGRGGMDVQIHYLNDEGDVSVVYGSRSRLVQLGVLEGETVERQEVKPNYGYHKLYGYGTFTADADVFDNGATDMAGVPMGVGCLELVERQGETDLPVLGRDYSSPLWEVTPAERVRYVRHRTYAAKH